MKVKVTLTDDEVRTAIKKAIKEKLPDLEFYSHNVHVEGSVKYKKKAVRKLATRIIAFVECGK
jgi:hypothetical protein